MVVSGEEYLVWDIRALTAQSLTYYRTAEDI